MPKRKKIVKKPHWSHKLKHIAACEEARYWAKQYRTFQEAWNNCSNGFWMEFLIVSVNKYDSKQQSRVTRMVGAECAKLSDLFQNEYHVHAAMRAIAWRQIMPKAPKLPNKPRWAK